MAKEKTQSTKSQWQNHPEATSHSQAAGQKVSAALKVPSSSAVPTAEPLSGWRLSPLPSHRSHKAHVHNRAEVPKAKD